MSTGDQHNGPKFPPMVSWGGWPAENTGGPLLGSGMITLGTCSLCGDAVQIPAVYMSTSPPVPTCAGCGAVKADRHGPTIDMVKAR